MRIGICAAEAPGELRRPDVGDRRSKTASDGEGVSALIGGGLQKVAALNGVSETIDKFVVSLQDRLGKPSCRIRERTKPVCFLMKPSHDRLSFPLPTHANSLRIVAASRSIRSRRSASVGAGAAPPRQPASISGAMSG